MSANDPKRTLNVCSTSRSDGRPFRAARSLTYASGLPDY